MTAIQHREARLLLDTEHQLLLVAPSQLPLVWDHATLLLLRGREHWEKFATLESIYEDLSSGRRQLWMVNSEDEFLMALLSEIVDYPTTKVLNILWVGGSGLEIVLYLFLDFIELWGVRQGAGRCQVFGRKGWVRKLKGRGYTQDRWVISKDLTNIKEH